MKVEATEVWTNIGIMIGGVLLAIAAYYGKKVPPAPPAASAVVAGVGLELGSRDQTERMIGQLTRIADALESISDHRQSDMKEAMDELLEKLRTAERMR